MKKFLFFSLFIVLVSSSVVAQTKAKPKSSKDEIDPFSLIITAGSNWSIYSNPANSASAFTQAKQVGGISFSIAGNWPLVKNFSLQVGARLTEKGSRVYADTPYFHIFSTSRPLYLELPIGFEYTHKLNRNFKFFVGVGGYIAEGIGGKTSYSGISGQLGGEASVSGHDKIVWGNPTSTLVQPQTFGDMKKYDYGFTGIAGITYWKLRLALNYEEGLAAIAYGDKTPNPDSKNKTMSLTVGFQF